MRKVTQMFLTAMLTCGIAMVAPVWGATWEYTYAGDVIPTHASYSAQGWTAAGGGTYTTNFGVSDGGYEVAVLDSSGAAADKIGYRNLNVHTFENASAEARMRVDADAPLYSGGIEFTIWENTFSHTALITKTSVLQYTGTPIVTGIDTTVYHIYRIEVENDLAGFYLDGVYQGNLLARSRGQNTAIYWGDLSTSNGGKSYWDYVSYNTVPEPATMGLLGIGGLGLLIRRQQRR